MYRAVHADRSGRILVTDHPALAFDGLRHVPFANGIALPPDTAVIGVERDAYAAERSGRPRRLGAGRLAAAACLPPGHVRLQLPSYADANGRPDLAPRPYAAVAADESGALVVAAAAIDRDPSHDAASFAHADVAAHVADGLRARPGDRLVRQLARCAKDYGCHAAANAFHGRWECALPVAAPANERPPAAVAPRRDGLAEPTESAAFHPTAEELARLAADHFRAGGTMVAFGRACEGEPLLAAREIEDAIARMRGSAAGTIHLETNGSVPGALRRLAAAGLESVAFRMASARAATYEALHRPDGYRLADVRASIRVASEMRLSVALAVLVHPGLTDRPDELDALAGVASELPEGSALLLRDLHADPLRALALVPDRSSDAPLGMIAALERLREELPHIRLGAFVRPLAKVPHVP